MSKIRMRVKVFGVIAGLVSSSYMYGINLNATLNDVLHTHPDILEKQKTYNATIEDVKSARSGFFPTLVFEGAIGFQTEKESSTGYENEESSYYDARITARQNIFDNERVGLDEDIRHSLAWSSLYSYLRVSSNIAFDTIKAYINVLKLHELKKISQENVHIHSQLLKSVRLRMDAGNQGRSELERVLARLATAKTKMLLRQSEYERSLYALHKILGRFIAYEDMVKPVFDDALLPATLKEALTHQISYHPAYKEGDYKIEQRKNEYKRQISEKGGKLYLEASANVYDDSEQEDENKAYIALKYDHTLYDGGKREHKAQRAVSLMHEEQQKQYSIRRTLRHDLELTWASYKLLYSQIGELKKSLYFTKKALQTYKEEFSIGRRPLINILDAQNEYQNALDQLIAMQYDILSEKFRVLYSEGTLLEHLGLLTKQTKNMLMQNAKENKVLSEDTLALSDDFDKDNIKDPYDVSVNNTPDTLVNALGVNKKMMQYSGLEDMVTQEIQNKMRIIKNKKDMVDNPIKTGVFARFDFISFIPKSIELSEFSKDTMRYLIKQLKNYTSEGMLHIVVGTNEFEDESLNYKLAMNRAYNFKRILVAHNIDSSSISVFVDTQTQDPKSYLGVKIINSNTDYKKQYVTHNIPGNIFKKNSQDLNQKGKMQIKELAKKVRLNNTKHVDIVVYSNDYKDPIKNRNLSILRSQAINDFLINNDISREILTSFGWGEYKDRDYLMSEHENSYSRVEYVLRDK